MGSFFSRCVIATFFLCFTGLAGAASITIDFEGFLDADGNPVNPPVSDFLAGRIIDDEFAVAPFPGFSTRAENWSSGPDLAVIFDTDKPTGGDSDLGAPFSSLDPNLDQNYLPGNVLIIQERHNCDLNTGSCTVPDDEGGRPAGFFEFVFEESITLESLDFFDIEGAENNNNPDSRIWLFDEFDNDLAPAPFFVPGTGGDNKWAQLSFGGIDGVRRLRVQLGGSGAIDNLTYSYPSPPNAAVPLPPSVLFFGSAIGLLAWTRRGIASDL